MYSFWVESQHVLPILPAWKEARTKIDGDKLLTSRICFLNT